MFHPFVLGVGESGNIFPAQTRGRSKMRNIPRFSAAPAVYKPSRQSSSHWSDFPWRANWLAIWPVGSFGDGQGAKTDRCYTLPASQVRECMNVYRFRLFCGRKCETFASSGTWTVRPPTRSVIALSFIDCDRFSMVWCRRRISACTEPVKNDHNQ